MNAVDINPIKDLLGKTFDEVRSDSHTILDFISKDGPSYRFWHEQDCCESVTLEDIVGDLNDLAGSPILQADEVSSSSGAEGRDDSNTWTFYKFATAKGRVTVRWWGSSNGYYSETVDFVELQPA